MTRPPDLIIAGAQKCGTTALASMLDQHPDMAWVYDKSADTREMHYFDKKYDLGPEWYLSHFERHEERVVFEKTPQYLCDYHAHHRIARDLPDVRVVVILRDPVERFISQYYHKRFRASKGSIEEPPLLDGVLRSPMITDMIRRGLYGPQVASLAAMISDRRLLVIYSSDMASNPPREVQRVWAFMGLGGFRIEPIRPTQKSKPCPDWLRLYLSSVYAPSNRALYHVLKDEQILRWT